MEQALSDTLEDLNVDEATATIRELAGSIIADEADRTRTVLDTAIEIHGLATSIVNHTLLCPSEGEDRVTQYVLDDSVRKYAHAITESATSIILSQKQLDKERVKRLAGQIQMQAGMLRVQQGNREAGVIPKAPYS